MYRYTFEAPAVACFEIEASNEAEARAKAAQVQQAMTEAYQPAPHIGPEADAHDARYWTLGADYKPVRLTDHNDPAIP